MRSRRARITLKVALAYLVASVPGILLGTIEGPHGRIMSLLEAFAFGLGLPWEGVIRAIQGRFDLLVASLVLFWPLFIIGLLVAWFTERRRAKVPGLASQGNIV